MITTFIDSHIPSIDIRALHIKIIYSPHDGMRKVLLILYPHFIGKEIKTERLNNLPNISHQVTNAGSEPRHLQSMHFNPYTMHIL